MKFSLNRITAQKVTTLQNTVRRLIIIVLSFSYDAYNQSVTFKLCFSYCAYDQNDTFELSP